MTSHDTQDEDDLPLWMWVAVYLIYGSIAAGLSYWIWKESKTKEPNEQLIFGASLYIGGIAIYLIILTIFRTERVLQASLFGPLFAVGIAYAWAVSTPRPMYDHPKHEGKTRPLTKLERLETYRYNLHRSDRKTLKLIKTFLPLLLKEVVEEAQEAAEASSGIVE